MHLRAPLMVLALSLAASLPAEQRLEPAVARTGQTVRYVLESASFDSVEALARTTVHAPVLADFRPADRHLGYRRAADGTWIRRDVFEFVPDRPGRYRVEPALVERPDGVSGPRQDLTLDVIPPGRGVRRGMILLVGVVLLLPAVMLLRRGRGAGRAYAQAAAAASGSAGERSWRELLHPAREAKLRGDVRGFYVSLYAVLRAALRRGTVRSPRDPRGLAAAALGIGLGRARAEELRKLAQLCERVAFGGERPDPAILAPDLERAEGILAELERCEERWEGKTA